MRALLMNLQASPELELLKAQALPGMIKRMAEQTAQRNDVAQSPESALLPLQECVGSGGVNEGVQGQPIKPRTYAEVAAYRSSESEA